jgi:hypothetical protein
VLSAALVTGATSAAFVDSEYGNLFNGAKSESLTTGMYNIQIRAKGETVWKDTSLDGKKDNLDADANPPIDLKLSSNLLVPGDDKNSITTSFEIRNDSASTYNSSLRMKFNTSVSTGKTTHNPLRDVLMFNIKVGGKDLGTKTYAAWNSAPAELTTSLKPNGLVSVDVGVYLPTQGALKNAELLGKAVYLVAQVDGASV